MHMNFTSDGSERCSRGPATTRIPGKSEATMVACALNFECWSLKSVSDVNASIALATWSWTLKDRTGTTSETHYDEAIHFHTGV